MRYVTREEMQEIDRTAIEDHGIPGETLMENAGKAVTELILNEFRPKSVTITCGKGNNGGDGFVVARLLRKAGVEVTIDAAGEPEEYKGDARTNFDRVLDVPRTPNPRPDVWVDALFGTGLQREVAGDHLRRINEMNAFSGPVVAVDVPSGLDADTGEPLGAAVRADVTVTMGLPKVGFQKAEAFTGRVVVADIGFPRELI